MQKGLLVHPLLVQMRKLRNPSSRAGQMGRHRAGLSASPAERQSLNKGPAESTKGRGEHSEHKNYIALLPSNPGCRHVGGTQQQRGQMTFVEKWDKVQ